MPPFDPTPDPAPTTGYPTEEYTTTSGTGFTGSDQGGQRSTTDVAKDQAGQVKDTAVDAGMNVASTTKDEASNVLSEAQDQAKSMFHSVTSEVKDQVGSQQQKIAGAVHAMAKELGSMASSSSESGPLTDLAHQASRKGGEIAHWLENREPSDVLEEVKRFARRRPVMFLALCGAAGVLAGRITRGAVAANTSLDSNGSGPTRALETQTYQQSYAQPYAQPYAEPISDPIAPAGGYGTTGTAGTTGTTGTLPDFVPPDTQRTDYTR